MRQLQNSFSLQDIELNPHKFAVLSLEMGDEVREMGGQVREMGD
jgi:hypothetical protein